MIIVTPANDNNREVSSGHASYSSALSGSNLAVGNETFARVGQIHQTSNNWYYVRQYFAEYSYVLPANQIPVSGHYFFRNQSTFSATRHRRFEIREFNWAGATPTTAAFRTPAQQSNMLLTGFLDRSDGAGNNSDLYVGLRQILGQFNTSGDKRFMMATSRNRLQNTPARGEREDHVVSSASFTVADQRPRIVVGLTTENLLHTVLAAQVQLSDGSWVVMERTSLDRSDYVLQARRVRTDGTSHVIWTAPSYSFDSNDNFRGTHSVALARSENDTLFICHTDYASTDRLSIRSLTRTGSETWSAQPARSILLPTEAATANVQAVAMAWHSVAGGRLVVVATNDWGALGGTQAVASLVSAPAVISGTGTLVLTQGASSDLGFSARPANPGRWNPINATGTLFDIHADSVSAHRGYFLTAERHAVMGSTNSLSIARYQIHTNGNQFTSNSFSVLNEQGGWASHDPDSKARIIAAGQSGSFVKVAVDPREERGLTVDSITVGDSNLFMPANTVYYDTQDFDMETLPAGADFASKMTWDAVYFTPDNSVWIYYLDKDNPRRLMRTAFRVGTHQAQQNEVQVVAELAPSGHTIHAIRVQRNRVTDDNILITAASEDGSGNHHMQYHVDRINVAPTQPLLNRIPNFDATNDQLFSWVFQDANFTDTQSAYRIQVVAQADSSVAYDSGKVTSGTSSVTVAGGVIDNNEDMMWRVMVWDTDDEASPWSEYSVFSTSDTGVVEILFPDMDNDPDIYTNDILIEWEVQDADQDEYRVTLTRTEDQSTWYDSGWVTSPDREHLVPSLESDVEYMVQVRARMVSVESAPGFRLLTTHYATVEEPIIIAEVHPEYIAISVTNPDPRGARPAPTVNRVFRRLAGSQGLFKYVGYCLPNDTFLDYDVSSDAIYEYKVRAGVEA